MNFQLVYNTTDAPVVIDAAGRVLAGGEWGPADVDSDVVVQAFDRGTLVPGQRGSGDNDEATAAADKASALNDRASSLAALDQSALVDLAVTAGVIDQPAGDTPTPEQDELVALLVHDSTPVPEPAPPPAAKTAAANTSTSSKTTKAKE